MASSAARRVAVRDFRVRFVVEPQLVPQLLYALLETGADMVVHYQGVRARPALGACAAAPDHPVDMLTDERPYSRLPDAACRHRLCCVILGLFPALSCRSESVLARFRPVTLQSAKKPACHRRLGFQKRHIM